MDSISGKKLLILGANPETIPLVRRANELGVRTVVTDYTPGAPAKKYAAEQYDIDGSDVNALVALGKEIGVDGVLVGVADRLITSYQQVCQGLKLPCYGTREQCEILTDKIHFNEVCAGYGIHGIPSYALDTENWSWQVEALQYPIFIKPADSNSGKGMSICRRPEEVKGAIDHALEHSKSKRFLTERYMTCDDIFIFYTFVDGECWPSIIADRFTLKNPKEGSAVCLGCCSPSKYVKLYEEKLHPKMCRMFRDLQMKDGVLMVSAFVENGEFFLYDPGFRLQGEAPNLTVKAMTGFDHLDMLIHFALTGKNIYQGKAPFPRCDQWGEFASTIWYLLKPGKIEKIIGLEDIRGDEAVFDVVSRFREGDTVLPETAGTEGQVFARVYLSCKTINQLKAKVEQLQNALRVIDDAGNDMLLPGFHTQLMDAGR